MPTDGRSRLYRYTAFTTDPAGGNPAGVWIGDELPDGDTMQQIAAEVGFSETAFIAPASGFDRIVRYYSPIAEVTFCGHATIASGVILGETHGAGTYQLASLAGEVPVATHERDGRWTASLTSVEPGHEPASKELVAGVLQKLGWKHSDLDGEFSPVRAYAGAWHLVLLVAEAERLADLDYDFESMKTLMQADGLTTLQLIWKERADLYHARDPFPVGGVVEDPATGAAAAAFGGVLRDRGYVSPPATITIRQGEVMGRPSVLTVDIPTSGGIVVSGTAVPLE